MHSTLALAGNPNSGKTSLFNLLTGSNGKVGNWAGVTVAKKEGLMALGQFNVNVVDLPGVYGLTAYSEEEIIARDYILKSTPDVIVNLIDANNLERNLYLSLQLAALEKPMMMVINMMDDLERKGVELDVKKLAQGLGLNCPIIGISAATGQGMEQFFSTLKQILQSPVSPSLSKAMTFPEEVEQALKTAIYHLNKTRPQFLKVYPARWLAMKLLEADEQMLKELNFSQHDQLWPNFDYESTMINAMYQHIERSVKGVLSGQETQLTKSAHQQWRQSLDVVFTNRWLGIPIFAMMMYLMFWLTFSVGGLFTDMIEQFFGTILSPFVASWLEHFQVANFMVSLIVDGLIGGVGAVLTFLPNIVILFLAIAILEDTGYMARVAYIMDRLMSQLGLNGKAIVPMIMGFGCNTPAILGTRILESENDRLVAILINPFISCGARLPIYVLLSSVFFPGNESLVTFSLYMLGLTIAILSALLFKNTLFKGEQSPFLLELPPYRIPSKKSLTKKVVQHAKAYVFRAGTLIFAASMVIWFILSFGPEGFGDLQNSFGRSLGEVLVPFFTPLGFGNWQASLSLLTGVVAKEIVISNMSIIYGMGNLSPDTALNFQQSLTHLFTPRSAYAFMVFSLLYTPCIAVISVMRSETGSWKWPMFSIGYTLFIAWLMGTLVYQLSGLWF